MIITSCSNKKSSTTGWEYNNSKNGGFETNEKFVGLHPFMKYEVSSDSKKTEFYSIKQIIQSTFVYDGISRGEGTEQEIDIDSII